MILILKKKKFLFTISFANMNVLLNVLVHDNNISSVAYTIGSIESILKGKWYTIFNLSLKSNFILKIEFLLDS